MPNWVFCNNTISGPAYEIARFMAAARGANRYHSSDEIVDWGAFTNIQLETLMQEAQAHSKTTNENGFCFHALYPMPLAVQILPYGPGTLQRAIAENEGVAAFCKEHGVNISGYDWEIQNWGVKWGDCCTSIVEEGEDYLQIYFETAWGAPHEFWKKVSADYPELIITMNYNEEARQFEGEAQYQAGEAFVVEWEPEPEGDGQILSGHE